MAALEAAITKSDAATTSFDRQAARLTQASADAAEQAESLRERDLSARRDLFLKTARFIIEDLNSTAIDLTRVLHDEVTEADWKRYVRGDRGVFARTLLRARQNSIVPKIAETVDRKSVGEGKSVSGRVNLGGRR